MDTALNPRIRSDLEFIPFRQGDKSFIMVRDAWGLVGEGKAIPEAYFQIMTLLDGTRSFRDIQLALMRQRGGELVGTDEIERLLDQLDRALLLDSQKYQRAKKERIVRFSTQSIRPSAHSGRSYPENESELKHYLDGILNHPSPKPLPEKKITALMAPHIDISVGKSAYAGAYQWLESIAPTRIIILGIAHQMPEDLFCLTTKDFETPLGVVKNDRASVEKLIQSGQYVIATHDFFHKAEHSIEFQVLFIQHILKGHAFSIVPVLCGSVNRVDDGTHRNGYLETAGNFLNTLSRIIEDDTQDTLLVAGVDFSHIGPKFGHGAGAIQLESQSTRHDHALLEALSQGNTNAFWAESQRVKDQYHVCGFSALACLLEVIPPSKGHLLDYQCKHETATDSAVSFAAMAFTAA